MQTRTHISNTNDNSFFEKTLFGAYLNLATHNAYVLIADASKILGFKMPTDDSFGELTKEGRNYLLDALKNDPSEKRKAEIADYFLNRMPFLYPMVEGQKSYLEKKHKTNNEDKEISLNTKTTVIRIILKSLWDYRNYYTHYKGKEPEFDPKLLYYLRSAYDAGIRKIQSRYGYTPNDVKHLLRLDQKREEDKRNNVRLDRENFYYSFYDKKRQTLSEKGIIYLTCLFLERQYSQAFLKKFRGFKDERERWKQATLDAFTVYGIRLPKNSVVSGDPVSSLILSIFNELIKVPKTLYDRLEKVNQRLFQPQTDEGADDLAGDEVSEQPTLLIRKKNYFNLFALHFLDAMELLADVRFQILYGRFYYHIYEPAGSGVPRKIKKDLFAFGHMREVSSHKKMLKERYPDLFKESSDIPRNYDKPYILDFQPRFLWDEPNIVFSLTPKIPPIEEIISKKRDNEYAKPKSRMADFVMSMHELPALIFYIVLMLHREEIAKSINNKVKGAIITKWKSGRDKFLKAIINDTLKPLADTPINRGESEAFNQRKEKLKEVLKRYTLDYGQIPGTIRDYLLNILPDSLNTKVKRILQNMIDESQKRLDDIDKRIKFRKGQKPGQRGHRIQVGKLAEFVAKDMVFFQKKGDGKNFGVPNADEFQAIQASLAKWPYTKDDFLHLAGQFNLFDSRVHPFLKHGDFSSNSFISVYQNYLKSRKKFLSDELQKLESGMQPPTELLQTLRIKIGRDIRKAAERMLHDHPVPLPRGLFLRACIDLVKKEYPGIQVEDGISTQKLIQRWFKQTHKDNNQHFYDFPRNYPVIDLWKDNRRKKSHKKKVFHLDLNEREQFFKEIKHALKGKNDNSSIRRGATSKTIEKWRALFKSYVRRESELKLQTAQDILLYLMGLMLFKKITHGTTPMEFPKLNFFSPDIRPKGEKRSKSSRPLEQTIPKYFRTVALEYKPREYTEKTEKNTKKVSYLLTIEEEDLKMKDFGKFNRIVHDKRLPSLMPYLCTDSVNQATVHLRDLKNEFEQYERARLEILGQILKLEETIAGKPMYKEKIEDEKQKKEYVEFQFYAGILKESGLVADVELKKLKALRNAFAHNQYPDRAILGDSIPGDSGFPVIDKIANFAVQLITATTKKIANISENSND